MISTVKTQTNPDLYKCFTCQKSPPQEETTLKVCGACDVALYCDKDCQIKDFGRHKEICQTTKLVKTASDAVSRLTARRAFHIDQATAGQQFVTQTPELPYESRSKITDMSLTHVEFAKAFTANEKVIIDLTVRVFETLHGHPEASLLANPSHSRN